MARMRSRRSAGKPRRAPDERSRADRIFERNLATLKTHKPDLVEIALGAPEGAPLRVERDADDNVINVFKRTPDGEVAYFSRDPDADLMALWERTDWSGASIMIVLGMGFGRELLKLMQEDRTRLRRIIVIEPDPEMFRVALRSTPLTGLLALQGVELHVGLTLPVLTTRLYDFLLDVQNMRYVKTLTAMSSDGAQRFDGAYLAKAMGCVKQAAVESLISIGNSPQDALLGLENTLRNLPVILSTPGVTPLYGMFQGKPAVVASAGPSLSKSFDQLRAIQDEVLILCPDTSLKPLMDAGIRPHLVCSRERTPRTRLLFEGHEAEDCWLAGVPVLDERCFDNFDGPVLSVFRLAGHFLWVGLERGILEFNGSAGNMAYRLASEMGCSPIILVGQDLAFAPDGATHVGGAATGSRQKFYDSVKRIQAPGNSGRPVVTTKSWLGFLHRFEYDIARSERHTINTSADGALIRGTEVMPLDEAIDKHAGPADRFDTRKRLREVLTPPGEAQCKAQIRFLDARLRQTRELCGEVISSCEDGIRGATEHQQAEVPAVFQSLPPDVQMLVNHDPLKSLHKLRSDVIGKRMFQEFVMPTAQSMLVNWEVDFYALQRTCKDGGELYRSILPRFVEWFLYVRNLTEISVNLLPYGEKALHEAFPDQVPPPQHPLPDKTMLERIRETTPEAVSEERDSH